MSWRRRLWCVGLKTTVTPKLPRTPPSGTSISFARPDRGANFPRLFVAYPQMYVVEDGTGPPRECLSGSQPQAHRTPKPPEEAITRLPSPGYLRSGPALPQPVGLTVWADEWEAIPMGARYRPRPRTSADEQRWPSTWEMTVASLYRVCP